MIRMPLPDAQANSPRVYKLLKNKTLDSEAPNSLSQTDIASVGNPISIEQLNEDELRRLILVNLALFPELCCLSFATLALLP